MTPVFTIPTTPAGQLASLLLRKGLLVLPGPNVAWPISISHIPDDPNEAMAFYDTTGTEDGRLMESGERVEHPGFQIKFRSKNYDVGYAKARLIAGALDTYHNEQVPSGPHGSVIIAVRRGPVLWLGNEVGKVRHLFTVNGTLSFA